MSISLFDKKLEILADQCPWSPCILKVHTTDSTLKYAQSLFVDRDLQRIALNRRKPGADKAKGLPDRIESAREVRMLVALFQSVPLIDSIVPEFLTTSLFSSNESPSERRKASRKGRISHVKSDWNVVEMI